MLFYENYGRYPNLFIIPKKSPQIIDMLQNVVDLKQLYKKIMRNINYNEKRTESYANRKRKKDLS